MSEDDWLEEESDEYVDEAETQKKRKRSQKLAANKRKRDERAKANAGLAGMGDDERKTLVGEAVRFAIMRQSLQKPLTTGEVKKHVIGERYAHLRTAKLVKDLIEHSDRVLKRVFGLTLTKGDGNFYFLNYAFTVPDPSLRTWTADASKKGLLFTVISLLHVAPGGSLEEDELFDLLRPLGFSDGEPHPVFGDWKALIRRTFVGQKYLTRKLEAHARNQPKVAKYRMGQRAAFETDLFLREKFVSEQLFNKEVDELRMQELIDEQKRAEGE